MKSHVQQMAVHYNEGRENERLTEGPGLLEWLRTCEVIQRYLPPTPAAVLDIGGGSGPYALWLARAGYQVHLLDMIPLHIEQARQASAAQPEHPLAGAGVGDARSLEFADESADLVLLLGPLYHLTEREDRVLALREAGRVLRPGGTVIAAAISRYASTLDGLFRGFLNDPEFGEIARQDLKDGQHRNPNNRPGYFTTAYFHHPAELRNELEEAGLTWDTTLAVEGTAWLLPDLSERLAEPARREQLLEALRWVEAEPSLLGASAHLLAVGTKPGR